MSIQPNAIALTSRLQLFNLVEKNNNTIVKVKSKGFIFNYMNINYIISVHHFQSILRCSFDDIRLSLKEHILWNELSIYEAPILNGFEVIKSYSVQLKKFKMIFMKDKDNTMLSFPFIDFKYIYYNPITRQQNMYIRFQVNNMDGFKGLSGSPIFNENNNLVGVFCKIEIEDDKIYGLALPTIYLIKSLTKKDNSSNYLLDLPLKISDKSNKLGNHIIYYEEKTNMYTIYHKSLKYTIGLDVFMSLEGDIDMVTTYNNTELQYIKDERFDNTLKIIKDGEKIKLNMGCLTNIWADKSIDYGKFLLQCMGKESLLNYFI